MTSWATRKEDKMNDKVKRGIVALRKQGITSAVLAKAFGLRKQQVAAYVAWATMRDRKSVV